MRCGGELLIGAIPRQGDPTNIALAMAKGASNRGVKIFEGAKATDTTHAKGRVTGVTNWTLLAKQSSPK